MAFGRQWLAEWGLDPDVTYLNHGTVGATPRRVLAEQSRIRDEIERNPSRFLLRELSAIRVGLPTGERPRMRRAADAVARFAGAEGDDLVFVDNATAGANSVLRNLDLGAGDEIVIAGIAYGAVVNTAEFAARERGAVVRKVEIPYPIADPAEVASAFERALTDRTRIAVVDHITSESALVLPLREIAALCARRNVPVLADGAHAPGSIPLDLPSLGVDWYTANLHKWAWAPRSCGFLWAKRERQPRIHPPVISWGLDQGYTTEFDWVGTRDPSPALAAPAAIAFMEELGVEAVRGYNHALAWEAGQFLTGKWKTAVGTPESMAGVMITLPLPESFGSTADDAARLRDALLFEDRIEVQLHPWRGRLWTRISVQIYNDMTDVERLAEAIGRHA